MLADILKIISPEAMVEAIKANPNIVLQMLSKFEAYTAFGQAMSTEQQVALSTNLDKLSKFFKTDVGRSTIANMVNEFIKFTTIV